MSCLQGGGVVRLFHRERECYVSAEGSFAENPAVVEDGKINSIMLTCLISSLN